MQQATSQVVNVCAVFIVGALVGITGWRGAFLLYAAFAIALLLMTVLGVREVQPHAEPDVGDSVSKSAAAVPDAARPAGFGRIIAPICALTTLMGILTVIPMAQLPFVLVDNGQGSARLVSIVLGINFVFAAASAMSFASFKVRFGKRPTFMGGLTCGLIGIAAMGIVQGMVPSCVAAALAGFGTGIYNTYVFDHGVEISPAAYHGRAAGLLFAFMFFGAAINPLVAGVFEGLFGLHHAFPVMAVVAFFCGLPVILYRPSPTRQEAASLTGHR
jgi:MFS family permease